MKGVIKTLSFYWSLYGGIDEVLRSPYLYISVFMTVICIPMWTSSANEQIWVQIAIDIIPSLLGFSMSAMAIMLAFSYSRFFQVITQNGKEDSYFMKSIANFFHYILVQTFALVVALISRSYPDFYVVSAIGFFVMIYGILVALAVAAQLLNTARIFNATALGERNCDCKKGSD